MRASAGWYRMESPKAVRTWVNKGYKVKRPKTTLRHHHTFPATAPLDTRVLKHI